jgi:Domain of unknown function (DUF4440)
MPVCSQSREKTMSNNDPDDLKRLNRASFAAEENGDGATLFPMLTADFRLVRAILQIEDRAEMCARVSTDTSHRKREIVEDTETALILGDRGIVACLITLKEPDEKGGNVVGTFWNAKACIREGGRWAIRRWQVTDVDS